VSPRKADLNPYEPLSADAKKRALSDLDKIASKFVRAVSGDRKVSVSAVAERFGKGGMLLADEAKIAGMADEIAALEDLLTSKAKHQDESSRRSSARRHRIALLAQG
jgi:ClpP class serine protease